MALIASNKAFPVTLSCFRNVLIPSKWQPFKKVESTTRRSLPNIFIPSKAS